MRIKHIGDVGNIGESPKIIRMIFETAAANQTSRWSPGVVTYLNIHQVGPILVDLFLVSYHPSPSGAGSDEIATGNAGLSSLSFSFSFSFSLSLSLSLSLFPLSCQIGARRGHIFPLPTLPHIRISAPAIAALINLINRGDDTWIDLSRSH